MQPDRTMGEGVLLPGDRICTVEEYLPGDGTYDDGGIVRSAYIGVADVDMQRRTVRVNPINRPLTLEKGMEVLAVVSGLKDSGAILDIAHVLGKRRAISGSTDGMVHISNVSSRYVKNIRSAFAIGDIVLARIVQSRPAIRLTTVDRRLGVVKAFCSQCRETLEPTGDIDLTCRECNRRETRKLSSEYGRLNIVPQGKRLRKVSPGTSS